MKLKGKVLRRNEQFEILLEIKKTNSYDEGNKRRIPNFFDSVNEFWDDVLNRQHKIVLNSKSIRNLSMNLDTYFPLKSI